MPKHLTLEMIEDSPEIQDWLDQFPTHGRSVATALLTQLQFISRDEYAEWLKATLSQIPCQTCGLFAVRKFKKLVNCIWTPQGRSIPRPATSLGSEDLVNSVISGLIRADETRYLDNPSLRLIKRTKHFQAVLIDDSSGSGDRMSSFLRRMFNSPSFLSRWSYGLIHLNIVLYSRSHESEARMLMAIPGSDHGKRKFPKSGKVSFYGNLSYKTWDMKTRWGRHAEQIIDLCDSITRIPSNRRMGYGGSMSNVVFYHSIPNNIPGVLFCRGNGWIPLFPGRAAPAWLPELLERGKKSTPRSPITRVSANLLNLLKCVKGGRRKEAALSRAMGFDLTVVTELLGRARTAGFLNAHNRLTAAGMKTIWDCAKTTEAPAFDLSLYIPSKWCAGEGNIQPSGLGGETRWEKTESAVGLPKVDGGIGQMPLERTDAMTVAPSLGVSTQGPSTAREGGDTHGPLG